MRGVLFVYDFPHWKSWLGITNILACARLSDLLVIGAPYEVLPKSDRGLRLKARHIAAVTPADVCRLSNIPYIVTPHASPECAYQLEKFRPDIGIILGARVLPGWLIEGAGCPILNVHPGVLPRNRGLDAIAWAVKCGWPQGATVHVINGRIDAGPILSMSVLGKLEVDDCIIEIGARVDSLQLSLLLQTVAAIVAGDWSWPGSGNQVIGPYHSCYAGSSAELVSSMAAYRVNYVDLLGRWLTDEVQLVRRLGDRFTVVSW